jgi:hypothetical protein
MSSATQKHHCPDCRHCQWCGDDRCRLCLRTPASATRKLSFAEQIVRYEQLNRHCPAPDKPGA